MPRKTTFCLTVLFCISFLFPLKIFAQTLSASALPVATLDPSRVTVGLVEEESKSLEADSIVPVSVVLNHQSAVDVSVDVIVAGGGANVGQDYRLLTPRVTIPAGQVKASIEVEVFTDDLEEGHETAIFELVSATGAELNHHQKTHHLKILDDDGSWWRLNTIAGIVLRLLP